MYKKLYEQANLFFNFLYSEKMTIASGIFLAAGIIFHFLDMNFFFIPDLPIWLTIFISGSPIIFFALKYLLLYRKITALVLISIGILSAMAIGEFFAAAEVAFIMALGEILEERTVSKTKTSIQNLVRLVPAMARKIHNGQTEEIPAENVRRGDIIRILPGEQIPVDGIILSGTTSVNQAVLTGESMPLDKKTGDDVLCGTLNMHGSIDIECTRESKDSSLQKMVRLVEQASANNSPIQRTVDIWAVRLIILALTIALVTYLATDDLIRTVTVLVVFCPCAMALATPTSIMAAIGQASKNGVLIKSGHALEAMGSVNQLAFDKTGTLTTGKLSVTDIIADQNQDPETVLSLCALAEQRSEHPLAKAVLAHYHSKANAQKLDQDGEFTMTAGLGIAHKTEHGTIFCGKLAFMHKMQVSVSPYLLEQETILRRQGKALIFVAKDNVCLGIAALADTLRESAKESLEKLRTLGVQTALLTGDSQITAEYFAGQVAIDDIHAELLPEEKVQKIKEMQAQGKTVCMIGDGINDAPALKFADVGIAMGQAGSDISIESADIALIGEDLNKLAYLKKLSNATVYNIKLNIAIALGINVLAMILGILGIIGPVIGALTHNGGSILVVLNAARLYDKKIQ